MTKSIYFRMIVIFVGSVVISMTLGFFVNGSLLQDRLTAYIVNNLIDNGKTIIRSYEQSAPAGRDALLSGLTSLPNYTVRLYDRQGRPLHAAQTPDDEQTMAVTAAQISSVLAGGVYTGEIGKGFETMIVGLPFEIDGQPRALFIASTFGDFVDMLGVFLRNQLLIVLLFGILFIAISARLIVRPLQHLTRATRAMAKGDFTIRVRSRRKDEVGQLTDSFNRTAQVLGDLDRIRRQFVSDVSHEIQSPLTSIKGFTQALRTKKMDEDSRMRLLGIIEEESNRLSRLAENLLRLTSLESGHVRPSFVRYRLDEQIRGVIIACEPQWSAKRLSVEVELPETHITADRDQLSQLWTNLLGNAVKFADEDGCVRVRSVERHDSVEVEIEDDGCGIPAEELDNIFRPFYMVDKSRDREKQGNGIGLSIVRRIVELHEGEISVASRVGEGTTFRVVLPRAPEDRK